MGQYVPSDYTGERTTCGTCGFPAPAARQDWRRPDSRLSIPEPECTRCFVGRVANEVVSPLERRALMKELRANMRADAESARKG